MKKLCAFTIFFCSLMVSLTLCSLTEPSCSWRIKNSEDDDEDLRSDCLIYVSTEPKPMNKSFYTDMLDIRRPTRKQELILILLFATDEINKNPYILPNVSLMFGLGNAMCTGTSVIIDAYVSEDNPTLTFLNYYCSTPACDVMLQGPSWTTFLQMTVYDLIPEIFFGPFQPLLSDKVLFSYIYQIAQKDTCLPHAIVSLMLYFTWTWIGVVTSDDSQGILFLSDFVEEADRNGVCLAFVTIITLSEQLLMNKAVIYDKEIMTSSAKVVLIYGEMNSTLELSFRRWQYLGIQRIWVTTSQWDVITSKRDFSLDFFHGTITFEQHHSKVSKFRNFMETMNTSIYPIDLSQLRMMWNYFNCSFCKTNCSAMNCFSFNTQLEWLSQYKFDMALSEEGYNLYNAVYAVAHTFHELVLQQIESQISADLIGYFTDCKQMNSILKEMVFTNPVGELVTVHEKNKPCADYNIYSIWNFPQGFGLKVKIGEYSRYFSQTQQLHISEDLDWNMQTKLVPNSTCSVMCTPGFKKFHQEHQAVCCFDCVWCPENEVSNETDMDQCMRCSVAQYSNAEHTHCLERHVSFLAYEDPMGMALACMSLCFSALTALVLGAFVKYKDTPIVKANNRILSYILLISIMFCFLCSLLFIGHPNIVTCILQQTTFGVFFTVAVSTVLAKTVTVVLAFKLTTPGRKMRQMLVSGAPNFVIPICTLVQLVLCGIWLVVSPPFIDTDTHSEHEKIIIVCNKGSVIAFHCVLGYLGSLALGSFTVAFMARKLPDRFNEAKFLTFSMLVFCSVWITFLPVYHSTKGKAMVVVEVFSILTSSAGLLVCIFIPKCYVILIRPDSKYLQKDRDISLY